MVNPNLSKILIGLTKLPKTVDQTQITALAKIQHLQFFSLKHPQIDAEVMSVLTGLHTVLKVIRYSCATIDDRIKTARPQTAKEGKQHPLMWYSLEDLQQVLSVLVRTLKLQKTTDKEVFSRVFSVVADCGGLLMSTSGKYCIISYSSFVADAEFNII